MNGHIYQFCSYYELERPWRHRKNFDNDFTTMLSHHSRAKKKKNKNPKKILSKENHRSFYIISIILAILHIDSGIFKCRC